jgi:undecaprenyl-diphosphatase
MILVDEFIKLKMSQEFKDMFFVVIQLGAIMAVVVMYFWKLWLFGMKDGRVIAKKNTWIMWAKVIVACIPAVIVGLTLDDWINAHLYNPWTVAIALIVFGVAFIVIERWNKGKTPKINSISELSYKAAFIIGMFQLLAALFPGTSRSGATIVGALLIGVSRVTSAEFTFYLAVPVMFGASLLKLVKYGMDFSGSEIVILLSAMVTAFIVSVFVIKFLMDYIKKHDFTVFGWYRIVLGILVILYFAFARA